MSEEKQVLAGVPGPGNTEPEAATESKCPAMGGAHAHAVSGPLTNEQWWPNQLNLKMLHQNSALSDPMGERFNYAEEFKSLDLKAVIKDLHALMTDSQEWAGRLWPLWRPFHSYGVAQRRHVPHPRWPRRSGQWPTAFCTPQQLAGQCEPRQGAPVALAHQAEIRAEDLVGRPHGSHRQRRARVDGLQDIRFRWRTRRCLGTRRVCVLGT